MGDRGHCKARVRVTQGVEGLGNGKVPIYHSIKVQQLGKLALSRKVVFVSFLANKWGVMKSNPVLCSSVDPTLSESSRPFQKSKCSQSFLIISAL